MSPTRPVQLTLAFEPFTPEPGPLGPESHHRAGRNAARLCLEKAGISGSIVPHPKRGYLELRTGSGGLVPGAYLNISHTSGLAVAALSPHPVGVDVEKLSRDPSRALERFLSESDRGNLQAFRSPDPRVSGALLLWTAKEAFAKALGLGIQAGLSRLEVDLLGPRPYRAASSVRGEMELREPAIHWEIREEFLVALCTEASVLKDGITRFPG
jgi:phosphopantetheinyl transferase (holo-ACP synthase)